MRPDVFTAVNKNVTVLWDVKPCSTFNSHPCFGEPLSFLIRIDEWALLSRRRRQQVFPKRRYLHPMYSMLIISSSPYNIFTSETFALSKWTERTTQHLNTADSKIQHIPYPLDTILIDFDPFTLTACVYRIYSTLLATSRSTEWMFPKFSKPKFCSILSSSS
jgi:hypothetical protein